MSVISGDAKVLVCDACLTAGCWYGEFMCEDARVARLKIIAVADLRKMKLEHPDQWSDEKLIRIYGNADRDFTA